MSVKNLPCLKMFSLGARLRAYERFSCIGTYSSNMTGIVKALCSVSAIWFTSAGRSVVCTCTDRHGTEYKQTDGSEKQFVRGNAVRSVSGVSEEINIRTEMLSVCCLQRLYLTP